MRIALSVIGTFGVGRYADFDDDSVHDGWGIAPEKGGKGDAISAGTTTNMDTIAKEHSYRTLAAHGTAVGLSEGLMGNSEVGCVSHGLFGSDYTFG